MLFRSCIGHTDTEPTKKIPYICAWFAFVQDNICSVIDPSKSIWFPVETICKVKVHVDVFGCK